MVVGKVMVHLCLTLIIILKFSVEHDRVVTTLNRTLHSSVNGYVLNVS